MDGFASGAVLTFFPITFHDTTAIATIAKQSDKQLWTNQRWCCHASLCVIDWELSYTCIVTSWSGRQPSKRIIIALSRRSDMFTEEYLTSKRNVKVIKSTPVGQRRSKYSKQVRFFLVNVLFVFVTARSLNCTFTDFPHCIDSIYATAWPRRYSEPEILLAKLQQQRPNNSHRKTHLHLFLCVINACWDDILQYPYAPLLCLESY